MSDDDSTFTGSADKATSADLNRAADGRPTSLHVFKRIYLSPVCDHCEAEERVWCQDNVGPCDECGLWWIAYDLSTQQVGARMEET